MIWPALGLAGLALLPGLREALRTPARHLQKQAPGQLARLSRGKTHFQWSGPKDGPVAVLVHGLTTPSFVWTLLTPHLTAQGYRVLSYDLYGRGYSDAPRGLQTPDFFCAQLEDLLAHETVADGFALIGYSMGGAIATAFAARHPKRLQQLILLAPAGMGHDLGPLAKWAADWPIVGDWAFHMMFPRSHAAYARGERADAIEDLPRLLKNELHRRGYTRSVLSSLRGTIRQTMEAQHRAIARTDLPVTAIWGGQDPIIPLRAMGQLTQWNRAVRHHVIEDADHGLPFTHPAQVAGIAARPGASSFTGR
ncbi:alpha/beta fold hydrolase [Tropicibacter alexandrii]|uniref:alpha/beta fold hydrolase n=1 Tax=Tropicibacter alexandrii TaxID=2267683 RepID=UPI000EF4AE91|nr:alpha/beta hydrolase [Tropicibacter alexandrii]